MMERVYDHKIDDVFKACGFTKDEEQRIYKFGEKITEYIASEEHNGSSSEVIEFMAKQLQDVSLEEALICAFTTGRSIAHMGMLKSMKKMLGGE